MQSVTSIRRFGSSLRAFGLAAIFAASSAGAAVVWDLNPNNQDGVVLSPTRTFTSDGYQITARGYDDFDRNGIGTASNLYFKHRPPDGGANESGLGLANSPHHELNGSATGPTNFIQLDLRSILSQGFTNGQIAVTSLQSGESFQLFGSNSQGVLGTAISGTFTGLTFDDKFVTIPQFGLYGFISVVGVGDGSNVLPSRFSADVTPIPEVGTVLPIIGLLVAIGSTSLLRRRRAARMAA